MYSFIENFTLSQLANKHIGIKKVVNKTKNSEIPSTPINTFMLEYGTEKKGSTNWYLGVLKSKLNHRNKERIKHNKDVWYKDKNLSFSDIIKWNTQIELFESDFNECDSGYCGI